MLAEHLNPAQRLDVKLTFFGSLAFFLLCAFLLIPAFAQRPAGTVSTQSVPTYVPFSAVIETIEFKEVSSELQKVVLDRIGVRVGDVLTSESRQRIGRELGKVRNGMTFTYKPGSKFGTAKLIISGDC